VERPVITTYADPVRFLADMLAFRKVDDPGFSVLAISRSLRRISPTLVSLILRGQRKITLDRVDELSKLLGLMPSERQYFRDWISRAEDPKAEQAVLKLAETPAGRRKLTSSHILNDWVNVFVKDAFDLERVRKNPDEIYALLGGIASKKRIDQSIKFLLQHGYLRRNAQGLLIPEVPLHSVDQKIPNEKVRKFHKALLHNAKEAIDQYSSEQRYANALVLSLNQETYQKLLALIAEQAESLQSFAENLREGSMLYQVTINVSPTGGNLEKNK
jgi:uncharacterized protein (TIGR02147 family)